MYTDQCLIVNLLDSFSLRNNFTSQTLRKSGKSRVVSEFSAISPACFTTLKFLRDRFHPYRLRVYLQIINKLSRAITFMASCALHPYMLRRVLFFGLQLIGQLHDDVILLQLPESLSLLFSCAN